MNRPDARSEWTAADLDLRLPSPSTSSPGRLPATAHLAPRAHVFLMQLPGAAPVAAEASEIVDAAASSTGQPLPAGLRANFEASLGADLSAVRLHSSTASAAAAEALHARAYTIGTDIHFNDGELRPEDPFGMHLLAHEVAHTVQQGRSPASDGALTVSQPGDAFEVEADRAADAMVSGARAQVSAAAPGAMRMIQREPKPGDPSFGGLPSFGSDPRLGRRIQAQLGAQNWDASSESMAFPRDLEGEPPVTWSEGAPAARGDITGVEDYVDAFRASHAAAQASWNGLVPQVALFMEAGAKAEALGIQKNISRSDTQGWQQPQKGTTPNLDKYAEQQGAKGGPTVADMFKTGHLDPTFEKLKDGEMSKDPAVQAAISERRNAGNALGQVLDNHANVMPAELLVQQKTVEAAAIDWDAAKLDAKAGDIEAQKHEIEREAQAFQQQVSALTSTVGAVKDALAKDAAVVKSAGDAAGAIANLTYGSQLRALDAKIDTIKVKSGDAKVKAALNKKETAVAQLKLWVATKQNAIDKEIKDKFEAYKKAHGAAADAFRKAAEGAAKKDGKSEADQKKAGAEAESLLQALAAIEYVVATCKKGASSATPPAYSLESGAGYALVAATPQFVMKVGGLKGYKKSFELMAAKWEERLKEVKSVLNEMAT